MQTMSDKEFDAFFREKLDGFEVAPSDAVWGRIAGELAEPAKKRVFSPLWMAAASVVVIMAAGFWFMRPVKPIQLRAANVTEPAPRVEQSRPVEEKVPADASPKKESFLERLAQLKVGKNNQGRGTAVMKEKSVENDYVQQPVESPEGTPQQITVLATETFTDIKPAPVSGKLKIPDHRKPVIALADDNAAKEGDSEPAERSRPGIKTVGDLVNFVVAKVDKRKDKLIEFSENEEGTLISGINLGVLKIKAKNEDKRN